jgi:hypothetical protein
MRSTQFEGKMFTATKQNMVFPMAISLPHDTGEADMVVSNISM